MRANQLQPELDLQKMYESDDSAEIVTGYTSDLLSDVMANAQEDSVLITIQAHVNTIAVASISGINAIIICNDRPVGDDMIEAAQKENISLYKTTMNQFTVSYKVYELLNRK
ncbi:hypothetical protein QA601_09415 [Chitinispirillales bacterium ANBcel5]|uniref:hypothetical protein n=1 Tax=Cellulosispirillum alkaliphilum TaxID=3039283 RepID=UPI002A505C9F|nr:hypothetical protein [Chitinispirillales bacterium ANBcel5]